jgi:phosphoribosylaminoimidazole (AIR) synthetase
MQGVYHHDKMILWDKVKAWDVIIALRENWFRSNGISSVRKALKMKYWESWFANEEAKEAIHACATPSILYDNYLTHLNGRDTESFEKIVDVHSIIHLSGGAFKGKLLDDLLKRKWLSAELPSLWQMPAIMQKCAQWRWMSDADIYDTRNGGQWWIIIVDSNDVDTTLAQAINFWVDAKVSWYISTNTWPSQVSITSPLSWEKILYTA